MIMTPNVSLKQATAAAWLTKLSEGSGDPTIALYTGTKPASPETAVSTQVLLGTGTCSTGVGTVTTVDTVVKLVFGAIAQDAAADADGVASWARFFNGDGVAVLDVDVSSTAGTGFFRMNTVNVVAGGPIAFTKCEIEF